MLPGQFPAISHRCTFNLTYSYNCSINIRWDGNAKIDNQWARYCGRAIQIWIQIQSIGGLFKFEFRFNQWAGLICNPEIWKFQIQRCEKRLDIAVASRILPWREFRPIHCQAVCTVLQHWICFHGFSEFIFIYRNQFISGIFSR